LAPSCTSSWGAEGNRALKAIICQGLTKHYGDVVALDQLDLAVEEGAIFGFLGPNGAGKTTTLKILTGLGRATGGKAWVAGEGVNPNSFSLQSKIGYLPEEPAFYAWMTASEYLRFVGELFHMPSQEISERISELLDLVDLEDAANRRVGGYSRGMRQRLGIAQALMNRPKVLFLDEPTSALDPLGRAEVLSSLARLRQQATTVFLSSHILGDVERVCDAVGIINRGRLLIQSDIEELRQRYARPVFELEYEEAADHLVDVLKSLAWVDRVESERTGYAFTLKVAVRDLQVAKAELPRIAAESGLTLRRYELAEPTLEEVFIEIMGHREHT